MTDPVGRVDAAIRSTIDQGLLPCDRQMLVAVSGGPDSLVLLDSLARFEPSLQLHVVHFDHQLRPESAADGEAVRAMARERNLPVTVGTWNRDPGVTDQRSDLSASRQTRDTSSTSRRASEAAAREARYRFFGEVAQQLEASHLAVAHTANDQVETVLARLVRGSGARGLAGIRPIACLTNLAGDLTIVRPLLTVTRQTILEYCQFRGLWPLLDSSNLDAAVQRNRLRHQVVPLLTRENPRLAEAIGRTSRQLAELHSFVRQELVRWWDSLVTERASDTTLVRPILESLHPALRREAIVVACERLAGLPAPIEGKHVDLALDLLAHDHGQIDLPGGLRVTLTPDALVVLRRPDSPRSARTGESVPEAEYGVPAIQSVDTPGGCLLPVPGEVVFGGWRVRAQRLAIGDPRADSSPLAVWTAEVGPFTVRSRIPGDGYRPFGAPGRRKVHDLLIDRRVPSDRRATVPVLVGTSGIVWLVGGRVAEEAKVSAAATQATRLIAERIGERGEDPCPNTCSSR